MSARPHPFPVGAKLHPKLRLVTWHPRGTLDASLAREVLEFVESQEDSILEPFHRFADLTSLSGIHLEADDILEISSRRVSKYHGPQVKSALLAFNAVDFGIAQMYARLVRKSPIEVRVFCRITSAAAWLGMPIEVLAAA